MLTLRKLFDGSTDPAYRAAIETVAQWVGWNHEATRAIMATIERLA